MVNRAAPQINLFLVIDRTQSESRQLLLWVSEQSQHVRHLLVRMRIIDVSLHAHAGVRKRIKVIPALISTEKPNKIVSGIYCIKQIMCGGRRDGTPHPRDPHNKLFREGMSHDQRKRPLPPSSTGTHRTESRPAVNSGSNRTNVSYAASSFPSRTAVGGIVHRREETRPRGIEPSSQAGTSWREKKVECLENDLEALIDARKRGSASGLRRIG